MGEIPPVGAPRSNKTLRGKGDTQTLSRGGLAGLVYIAQIGETKIVDGRGVKRGRQPQIDHLGLALDWLRQSPEQLPGYTD